MSYPEATNLRPGNLRVRTGDVLGRMVHGFAGDLHVAVRSIQLDEDVDV